MERWMDMTIAPDEMPTVIREPDGSVQVRFQKTGLVVILSAAEHAALADVRELPAELSRPRRRICPRLVDAAMLLACGVAGLAVGELALSLFS